MNIPCMVINFFTTWAFKSTGIAYITTIVSCYYASLSIMSNNLLSCYICSGIRSIVMGFCMTNTFP